MSTFQSRLRASSPTSLRAVAGLALVRDDRVLLVRKSGTAHFVLPGGPIRFGESTSLSVIHDVADELGVPVTSYDFDLLGIYAAPSVTQPGTLVEATIYAGALNEADLWSPQGDLDAARWEPLSSEAEDLSPLVRHHVLPALLEMIGEVERQR
jgi:8-oxo-dGTP diphosphatase